MKKKIIKCAVNGNLGSIIGPKGKRIYGICPHIKCGDDSICGAHRNTKCKYMVKE